MEGGFPPSEKAQEAPGRRELFTRGSRRADSGASLVGLRGVAGISSRPPQKPSGLPNPIPCWRE